MGNELMNDKFLKNSIIFFLLFLFLAIGCKNKPIQSPQQKVVTFTNDDGFSFNLPRKCRDVTLDEVGYALREVNPAIIFVAIVELAGDKILISISTYHLIEAIPIDSAFVQNSFYIATLGGAPVENYRIIDYGIKESNDKKVGYKISFNPATNYGLIYYLMEDNCSNILYELKATCQAEEKLAQTQAFIEQIAMSVKFEDP